MTKKALRLHMRTLRDQMDPKAMERETRIIVSKLEEDPDFRKAKCISIFYPMGNEINLLSFVGKKNIAFPKIVDQKLRFIAYEPHQAFVKSSFGVMEPMEGAFVDEQIDYMIVPALAISKSGHRIGYGKGYYDGFLSRIRPKRVVGVIYAFQEVEAFDTDFHDQKLDAYFTGKR